jgi:hypothetical protein
MAAVVPGANQPATQDDESKIGRLRARHRPRLVMGASADVACANAQNPAAGRRIHPDGADTTPANNGADYEGARHGANEGKAEHRHGGLWCVGGLELDHADSSPSAAIEIAR